MKNFVIALGLIVLTYNALAQEESLKEKIDEITYDWDLESTTLENYDGLLKFCKDKVYRDKIMVLLNEIHHYDSVLYDRAQAAAKQSNDKEIQKLIKEIESFETEYSMKSFISFLHDECKAQSEIEKSKKESKGEEGDSSYDSQVYVLEIELQKFVKHITERVDSIRNHVHHLGVK